MDGALDVKREFPKEEFLSIKTIVYDFYEWQKLHPGQDMEDKARAGIILTELRQLQEKHGMTKKELSVYGFDIDALEQGILRAPSVKNVDKS